MAKRLFLLLICSFIGIVNGPKFLSTTDVVKITNLDTINIVETQILPDLEPEPEPETIQVAEVASAIEPSLSYQEPIVLAPSNSIAVAGRVIRIEDVPDTTIDAGDHVNKYGDRFFYGHNSAEVFGGLLNLGIGNIFTIAYGGISTNYQVNKVVIYEKNVSSGKLQLNGAGNYMWSVANARSEGVQYNVSLMTCYGTSYGNGDASHRLVIFANAV